MRSEQLGSSRLEELLIKHADITDVLVTYERPLVTDIERRLLVSQPPGVSAEDRSTAANTLHVNHQSQLGILQDSWRTLVQAYQKFYDQIGRAHV